MEMAASKVGSFGAASFSDITMESPLFSFKRLDFSSAATPNKRTSIGFGSNLMKSSAVPKKSTNKIITGLAVASNILVLATSECSIMKWNLNNPNEAPEDIEIIPTRRPDDAIANIFIDPTGNHCILSLKNCDNYYLHTRSLSLRPKKISRLQGAIQSVAFDRQSVTDTITKSFLVGTSFGFIYEMSLESGGKEKICQLIHQLDHQLPITSLHFELVEDKIFIMCATSSPTRLYHFVGGPTFQNLFSDYVQSGTTSFVELPGDIAKTELHCYSRKPGSRPQFFAFMSQVGVYHGALTMNNISHSSDNILTEAQLMPYATSTNAAENYDNLTFEAPISLAATEFHFITLSHQKFKAISRLNGSLEQDNMVASCIDGLPLGLVRDYSNGSLYLYSDLSVYQVVSTNESRRAWTIYLDKALRGEDKYFETALEFCQKKSDIDQVMRAQAEFYLHAENVDGAAKILARANLPFDEVVLRLLRIVSAAPPPIQQALIPPISVDSMLGLTDSPQLSAIRIYLHEQLNNLSLSSKSQRTMVSTWLCEIYLHQITTAGLPQDSKNKDKDNTMQQQLIGQFKDFLRSNKSSLDQATVLSLLNGRGTSQHRALSMFYAQIVGNYDLVISQYMSEKRYIDAINILSDTPLEKVEVLIYKCSPVLIEFEPEATIIMLLNQSRLNITILLPAILRYASLLDRRVKVGTDVKYILTRDFEGKEVNFAIRYLRAYIERAESNSVVPEPVAYHTLIWCLAKYDEEGLFLFLRTFVDRLINGDHLLGLDVVHILRQCRRFKREKATIIALVLLGMDEEAVATALGIDVELAKFIAVKAIDNEKKKKLWVMIARYFINTNVDVKLVLSLIGESMEIIGIEDLLPYLPDFTQLDLFKDEICKTLEGYTSKIEYLKAEMTDLSDSADNIVNELESLNNRGFVINNRQKCEFCSDVLYNKVFYLFPCSHGYHSSCLLSRAHLILDSAELASVKNIESQLKLTAVRAQDTSNKRAVSQHEFLQNELDGLIGADCPQCGHAMIKSLEIPLISEKDDKDEIKGWLL